MKTSFWYVGSSHKCEVFLRRLICINSFSFINSITQQTKYHTLGCPHSMAMQGKCSYQFLEEAWRNDVFSSSLGSHPGALTRDKLSSRCRVFQRARFSLILFCSGYVNNIGKNANSPQTQQVWSALAGVTCNQSSCLWRLNLSHNAYKYTPNDGQVLAFQCPW